MTRTPPPRTAAQQQAAEREIALRIGTPAAVRAWAQKFAVPLIGMDDDDLLLISIHEARAELFPGMRTASEAWLTSNKARIVAAREATAIPVTKAMADDAPDRAARAIARAMKESM